MTEPGISYNFMPYIRFGTNPDWVLISFAFLIVLISTISICTAQNGSNNKNDDDDVVIVDKKTKKKKEVVDFSNNSVTHDNYVSPTSKKDVKIKVEKETTTPVTASRSGLRSHTLGSVMSPDGRKSLRLSARKNY